jgi:hypothetical protein
VLGEVPMFGFGYKARVEKIVEDELGYFVGATNSIYFGRLIKMLKPLGQNEYSTAIEFVLARLERLEGIWSKETGKVTNEGIISDIESSCSKILTAVALSNTDESETIARITVLLDKIRQ